MLYADRTFRFAGEANVEGTARSAPGEGRMSARRWLHVHGTLLVLAALSGCGGGGGGAGSTPPVTVTVTGPARFDAALYEGQQIPDLIITFQLNGDVSTLNGKTVYLFVDVPDAGLFNLTPSLNIDSTNTSGNVQFIGIVAPSGSAATYTNTVRTRVCLDSGCASQLRVVNPNIPYTVLVKPGLRVSPVVLETTFGTPAAPVTVSIGLPDGAQSWCVHPSVANSTAGVRGEPDPGGAASIVVSADNLVLPGTYLDALTVEAVTAEGDTLTQGMQVTYTTTASEVPFAFRQSASYLTAASGYPYLTDAFYADALFPGTDGDRFHYLDATYTWPPAADANAYRDGWLYAYMSVEAGLPRYPTATYPIELQAQGCYMGNCLPAGRYQASLHFQYTPASGPTEDAYYPVIFDITP
jgi:hypothetical protein